MAFHLALVTSDSFLSVLQFFQTLIVCGFSSSSTRMIAMSSNLKLPLFCRILRGSRQPITHRARDEAQLFHILVFVRLHTVLLARLMFLRFRGFLPYRCLPLLLRTSSAAHGAVFSKRNPLANTDRELASVPNSTDRASGFGYRLTTNTGSSSIWNPQPLRFHLPPLHCEHLHFVTILVLLSFYLRDLAIQDHRLGKHMFELLPELRSPPSAFAPWSPEVCFSFLPCTGWRPAIFCSSRPELLATLRRSVLPPLLLRLAVS